MVDAYAGSTVGFVADPVVDRVPKTLLAAEILFGRLDGNVAKQELDLVQFPSGVAAQASARPTEIVRRQILNGRSLAQSFTTCHTTRSVTPFPHVFPARQTHRKTRPSLPPADTSQESIALLTQSGTGTVRICRAFPTKSTIAQ